MKNVLCDYNLKIDTSDYFVRKAYDALKETV